MMEIAAAGDDHKALRKIAAALLAKAANGDVPAINSLADRTDGKVNRSIEELLKTGWQIAGYSQARSITAQRSFSFAIQIGQP